MVIPYKQNYESAKQVCKSIGGTFPMFENDQDIESWNETIRLQNRYDSDNNKNVMVDT